MKNLVMSISICRQLVQLVDQFGVKKWSQIAKMLNGRVGKQCRERWHNHLRPNIRVFPLSSSPTIFHYIHIYILTKKHNFFIQLCFTVFQITQIYIHLYTCYIYIFSYSFIKKGVVVFTFSTRVTECMKIIAFQ